MSWDIIIAITLIVGLVLAIWARISNQTIVELLRDLKDFLMEKGEEQTENATQVYG